MRDIRFRAWDKRNEKMESAWEWSGPFDEGWPWRDNNYIFMQYTGLKDKNGKEIYEGDIAKLENMPVEAFDLKYGFAICVVEWDEKYASFSFKAKINKTDNPSDGWTMSLANGFEVIGNIWENGDLLK